MIDVADRVLQQVARLRLTTLIGDDVPERPDLVVCGGQPGMYGSTAVLTHTEGATPPDPFDMAAPPARVESMAVTLWNLPEPLVRWVDERAGRWFMVDAWLTVPGAAGSQPNTLGRWTGWNFAPRRLDYPAGVDLGSVVGSLHQDVAGRFYTFRATTETMPAPTV